MAVASTILMVSRDGELRADLLAYITALESEVQGGLVVQTSGEIQLYSGSVAWTLSALA